MKQGLQAWLRWASQTPRGGLKGALYSMMMGPDLLGVIVAVWNIVGWLDLLLLNQGIKRKF